MVEKEVVVEREVPVEVVVEKEVPVEVVVEKEVVVEREVPVVEVVEVPVEVVVEKEVIRTIEVPTPQFAQFREAPLLTQKVQAGLLPPVDQRLPEDPMVIPVGKVGSYGGIWRRGYRGSRDYAGFLTANLQSIVRWTSDGSAVIPSVSKGWEASTDGTQWTFFLREGMKWSDGSPFTADDLVFQFEEVVSNDELTPAKPAQWLGGGQLPTLVKVDDYTVRYEFETPNFVFLERIADMVSGPAAVPFAPAHYLKQFHQAHASSTDLAREMQERNFDSWTAMFNNLATSRYNAELPSVRPWQLTNDWSSGNLTVIAERNPYFYAVDPAGNQLPYMDRIEWTLFQEIDTFLLRTLAGENDMQGRYLNIGQFPLLKENEATGGYRVQLANPDAFIDAIYFNQSWEGPEADLIRNKDFRIALSHALDKTEMNNIQFLGQALTRPLMVLPGHPYYPGPAYENKYIAYDPDLANQMLDDLGLIARNADGHRLIPGTNEPIHMIIEGFRHPDLMQLIPPYWEAVGIKTTAEVVARALYEERRLGNQMQLSWSATGAMTVPFSRPGSLAPVDANSTLAPAYGLYVSSGGADGVPPSQDMQQLIDLVQKGASVPAEEVTELGKEFNRLHADNAWIIAAFQEPLPIAINTNLQNVPVTIVRSSTIKTPSSAYPEQWFYGQ